MTNINLVAIVSSMQMDRADRADPEADPAARLGRLWHGYAEKVYGPDYPLYRSIAACVGRNRDVLEMLVACRKEAHDPNMLLASIQYLLLGGAAHPLAALYARAGAFRTEPLPEGLDEMLADFCHQYREELTALLNSRHVQTNETGRCGGIALGLIEAARMTGGPIALIDVGASAGLNLALDDYLLDFGPAGRIGPEEATVRLKFEVKGEPLRSPLRLPHISRRFGMDRNPIDVEDEDAARWLLACIWPGTGRQERARAAMRVVAGRHFPVRPGDMVTDLPAALEEMHPAPTVVITSWSYSYLPVEARGAFVQVLRTEGRRRPIGWVCCDLLGTERMFDPDRPAPAGFGTPSVLGVAVFDGPRVQAGAVAYMHSHGDWVSWIGSD